MDAKSSVNGVSKAGTPHWDPRTRLEGWLGNSSIGDSDPALRDALQAALESEDKRGQTPFVPNRGSFRFEFEVLARKC